MWRWGIVIAVSAGIVGCGGRDEEVQSPKAPPQPVPVPAQKPQEPVSIDPAMQEVESIAEAPRGSPRSVALRLTGEEWKRLRDYGVTLGAAAACSLDTSSEASRVGAWMDRKFPPGSEGKGGVLIYFGKVMELGAKSQASSGGDCAHIQSRIDRMVWP